MASLAVKRGLGVGGSKKIMYMKSLGLSRYSIISTILFYITIRSAHLEWGTQYIIQMVYYRVIHLKHIILLTNVTPINSVKQKQTKQTSLSLARRCSLLTYELKSLLLRLLNYGFYVIRMIRIFREKFSFQIQTF